MSTGEDEIKGMWNKLLDWYDKEDISDVQVAYSGGKDSTLVLDSAIESLDNVKAIIIDAEIYPDREVNEAVNRVKTFDVPFEVVETNKLENEDFCSNGDNRCFHCKVQLFSSLDEDKTILEGTNASEVKGHRPGLKAVKKYARAPLLETGISEHDVRDILRWRGHEVWDKPSFACLASRFPPGIKLTVKKLKSVENIEKRIFNLGVEQLRVRCLGETARIEVWTEDIGEIVENREKIIGWCKDEGFKHVSLDLQGYRTGAISGS